MMEGRNEMERKVEIRTQVSFNLGGSALCTSCWRRRTSDCLWNWKVWTSGKGDAKVGEIEPRERGEIGQTRLHELSCCKCSLHCDGERNSNHKTQNQQFLILTSHIFVFFNLCI
ncbi:hypothetical protein V8G54_000366, partial [Vigna mungo]